MFERLLLAIALLAVGLVAYRLMIQTQLKRVAAQVPIDPILDGLRPGIPTIVYFTTPGCIPCQTQQQPALNRLEHELGEWVQIVKIDATQDPDTADRWGVMTAPTTFVLNGDLQPHQVNHGVTDTETLKRQIKNSTQS